MGKGAQSTTASTTTNVDKRITASEGDAFALVDTNVNVAEGGSVTLITRDPGAAIAAIEAIQAADQNVMRTVSQLSEQAQQSAQLVAKSQESFVAVASGQRATITAVAIVGGAVALIALPNLLKKR